VVGEPTLGYFIEIPPSCPLFSTHPVLPVPVFEYGIMESWNNGRMVMKLPSFAHSNIPIFQY
jgi:hypothetical protein